MFERGKKSMHMFRDYLLLEFKWLVEWKIQRIEYISFREFVWMRLLLIPHISSSENWLTDLVSFR